MVGKAFVLRPGAPDHADSPVLCRHTGALLLPGPTAANATISVNKMRPIEANAGCLGHVEVHFEVATRWRRRRRGCGGGVGGGLGGGGVGGGDG
eukprot:scaffold76733_cov57-Phaeocystis_antarctica.AAC.3